MQFCCQLAFFGIPHKIIVSSVIRAIAKHRRLKKTEKPQNSERIKSTGTNERD